MKKQIRQISKFAAWLMPGILFSWVFCITSSFAQPEPPNAKKGDVWEVHYWVTVRGNFKRVPELGSGDPTVFYRINRDYEGHSKLYFSPRTDDPQAALLHPTFKDPSTKVHIKINDSRTTVYDPMCQEVVRIEETWTAEVFSWMGNKNLNTPALLKDDLLINRKALAQSHSL